MKRDWPLLAVVAGTAAVTAGAVVLFERWTKRSVRSLFGDGWRGGSGNSPIKIHGGSPRPPLTRGKAAASPFYTEAPKIVFVPLGNPPTMYAAEDVDTSCIQIGASSFQSGSVWNLALNTRRNHGWSISAFKDVVVVWPLTQEDDSDRASAPKKGVLKYHRKDSQDPEDFVLESVTFTSPSQIFNKDCRGLDVIIGVEKSTTKTTMSALDV